MEQKLLKDVTAEEMREHFDAVEEAARLREQLAAMKAKLVSMAQEAARRESELDVPIEITHNDFGQYGEIVFGGAIIGR
jgi:hypothetical protein